MDEGEVPAFQSQVARSLREARLIEIYVGEITTAKKPFLVQEVFLEQLSDYFGKALQAAAFREGQEGRLYFPDDTEDAWEVLLHWVVKRDLPFKPNMGKGAETLQQTEQALLINCWVLGDKYQIHAFQNEVMLEMLIFYAAMTGFYSVLATGIELTGSRSRLRRLLAEEMVYLVYEEERVELDQLDAVNSNGFMGDFLRAKEMYDWKKAPFTAPGRFCDRAEATFEAGMRGTWKEYMVGDHLPYRDWRWHEKDVNWVV
ncbi:hypothetical protein LTR97_003543 [Elasticomyces elasticus]|uniref:BTB domain-containing protein n=1 Tax=Elasticomyces elasticus TaxID=574655 RepID=A0AAN7WCP1_9PEZI|nr:hypothetical protein LTR97_003543 [Elasticomyces elasticus]